jgi:hypothetical protein
MMYVAMTRGRDTNSAYLYQRAAEQEYGLEAPLGAHVLDRGTTGHAARLLRAIIANHDQPITAHDIAAQALGAALPERVRRLHDRRAAAVQRRQGNPPKLARRHAELHPGHDHGARAVQQQTQPGPQSRLRDRDGVTLSWRGKILSRTNPWVRSFSAGIKHGI